MHPHNHILDSFDTLALYSFDTTHRILSMNKVGHASANRWTGGKATIGDCVLDFFSSEKASVEAFLNRALSGEHFKTSFVFKCDQANKYDLTFGPLAAEGQLEGCSVMVIKRNDQTKKKDDSSKNETKELNVLAQLNEGIIMLSNGLDTILYANEAVAKMTGYSLSELVQLAPTQLHNPSDLELLLDVITKCKQSAMAQSLRIDFVRKDQSTFLGTIKCSPSKWNAQVCIAVSIQDLSEYTKTEQLIRDNQSHYQALFEHSHDAIIILKSNGEFLTGNEAVIKLFNAKDLDTCRNTPPHEIMPQYQPDGRLSSEKAEEVIGLAMANGSHSFEWEYKKHTGEAFHASVALSIIKTEKDLFIQSSIRDNTEQIEIKKKLESQNALQNLLMKISSNSINTSLSEVNEVIENSLKEIGEFVHADRSYIFKFNYTNRTIDNTFEWCSEGIQPIIDETQNVPMSLIPEMINAHFMGDYIHSADTQSMEDSSSKNTLLRQGIKSFLTVPLMDGELCLGLVGFNSVKENKEYTEKEIAILRLYSDMLVNIRKRADSEQELQKLLETTKQQNNRLTEFSHITSHNLRASVSNLIGLSQIIEVVPESLDFLEMLQEATQKLDDTLAKTNDIITFENENDTIKKVDCNLAESVYSVLKTTNTLIKDNKAELNINIDESIQIQAFPPYLDSIFHNLITNAIKYGITNDAKKLDIYASQKDGKTYLYFQDYGLGMDLDQHRDKLFKLGMRLHNTSDGQGLGLFMTKRQIEAMGGQIEVESQINVGTTFKLIFV